MFSSRIIRIQIKDGIRNVKIKKIVVVSVMMGLFMSAAQAEELIGLYLYPGYVAPRDQYEKKCTLAFDGTVSYVYSQAIVTTHRYADRMEEIKNIAKKISVAEVEKIKAEIEKIRADSESGYDKYTYGGGDLPGFEFSAYLTGTADDDQPAEPVDSRSLRIHGEGKSLISKSSSAKKLLFKIAKLCEIKGDVREMLKEQW